MKKIVLLSIIFISLLCVGCSTSDADKFKKEYESLNNKKDKYGNIYRKVNIDKNNKIKYATASDIVKMIENKETFAVYFGFKECPWCRSVTPTLINVVNDLDVDYLYYVDIKNIRDELKLKRDGSIYISKKGSKSYYKLLSLLDNVLDKYEIDNNGKKIDTLEKRIYAPNVISIVSGKAVKLEEGVSNKQKKPNMHLTKNMIKETYNKFKCSLKCVVENKTVCTKDSAC